MGNETERVRRNLGYDTRCSDSFLWSTRRKIIFSRPARVVKEAAVGAIDSMTKPNQLNPFSTQPPEQIEKPR